MTIQVQVSNLDTQRDVKVTTRDHGKDTGLSSIADTCNLKPGEMRTFWIHLLRDLTVEEVNPTE